MAPSRTGPYAIANAIRGGCRKTANQREWLRCAMTLIDEEPWYQPRKHAYAEMCRELARHMNWHDRTSRPGHAALGAAAGRSADTVGRWVKWLDQVGLAFLVAGGWTPDLCATALASGRTNEAAVYVLCVPKKNVPDRSAAIPLAQFADLTRFSSRTVTALRTREGKPDFERPTAAPFSSGTPGRSHGRDQLKRWPLAETPQNRTEGEFAARALQNRLPILGRISARHLRSVLAPFWRREWTPLDVIHALDHDRDGREHAYRDPVSYLAGWLRSRLGEHCDGDGRPLDPPSKAAAEQHARQLAEQMSRRTAAEAAAAADSSARLAGEPTIAERSIAGALAEMNPPGSPGEIKIMTGRGLKADRIRSLLALGRRLAGTRVFPT